LFSPAAYMCSFWFSNLLMEDRTLEGFAGLLKLYSAVF